MRNVDAQRSVPARCCMLGRVRTSRTRYSTGTSGSLGVYSPFVCRARRPAHPAARVTPPNTRPVSDAADAEDSRVRYRRTRVSRKAKAKPALRFAWSSSDVRGWHAMRAIDVEATRRFFSSRVCGRVDRIALTSDVTLTPEPRLTADACAVWRDARRDALDFDTRLRTGVNVRAGNRTTGLSLPAAPEAACSWSCAAPWRAPRAVARGPSRARGGTAPRRRALSRRFYSTWDGHLFFLQ